MSSQNAESTGINLSIYVDSGRKLLAMDRGGTSDPFIKISLGNEKIKTHRQKKTLTPSWKEHFVFKNIDLANVSTELIVRVYDWDRVGKARAMGRARIAWSSLTQGVLENWFPLEKINKGDAEPTGEIYLKLHLEMEQPPFIETVRSCDLNQIQKSLSTLPPEILNLQDKDGYTGLHWAMCLPTVDQFPVTMAILRSNKEINVTSVNSEGNTPLHFFCAKFCSPDCSDAFQLFLDKGADVNQQNSHGETPLHKAIFNQSVKLLMMNLLLNSDADVNVNTTQHPIPLNLTNSNLLPTENAENFEDENGNVVIDSPLHYAVHLGREDLILTLLKYGANLNLKNKDNETAMELAHRTGHKKCLDKLQNAKDLFSWLDGIGLIEYRSIFIKEETFLQEIPYLDEAVLTEIGVLSAGHRVRFMKAVRELNGEKVEDDPNPNPEQQDEKPKPKFIHPQQRARLAAKAKAEAAAAEKDKEDKKDQNIKETLATLQHSKKKGDSWLIGEKELEFTEKLGSGASGTVYRGLYNGESVAIKVLEVKGDQEVDEFKKEFHILSCVTAPNVVWFYGACLEPRLCMVMEVCSKGSLYHVLQNKNFTLSWKRLFKFSIQMVLGILALHNNKPQILHRDFKSLNLLVTSKFDIKVCDFGLSRFDTGSNLETLGKLRGTFAYCAPEVYFNEKYQPKSDIYSIGICLWELVNKCCTTVYMKPFEEFPNLSYDFQIIIQSAQKKVRPTIPASCPEAFKSLITRCVAHEINERPNGEELLGELKKLKKEFKGDKQTWNNAIIVPK